jgi:DNA topoisomerase-1
MGEGKEKKFRPTALGRAVTTLLVARFPDLLDVKFTAKLEAELDEVAEGKRQWTPLVGEVYRPMMARLALAEKEVGKIEVAQDEAPVQAPAPSRSTSSRYGNRTTATRTGTGTRRPAAKTTATTRPRAAAKTSAEPTATPTRTRKPSSPRAKKTAEPVPTPPVSDDYSDWFGTPVVAPTKAAPKASVPPKPVAETGLTCDKCGKPMVKRKSQYGEFYGCSGFPNCRNIRKM